MGDYKTVYVQMKDWVYTLFNHRRIIAKWRGEALKDYELKMTEFRQTMDSIDATFEHPLNDALIGTMVRAFSNAGAENYCSITANYKGEQYEFIVQRKSGRTPAEIAGDLRRDNAELRKRLGDI